MSRMRPTALAMAVHSAFAVLTLACSDVAHSTLEPEAGNNEPVLAGRPTFIGFDTPENEAADSAFFSELCGFPVTVDWLGGGLRIHDVDRQPNPNAERQQVFLATLHLVGIFTNEEGESVRVVISVAPRGFLQDGQLLLEIAGRDIGGRGKLVIDLATGEILEFVGHGTDPAESICEPLS